MRTNHLPRRLLRLGALAALLALAACGGVSATAPPWASTPTSVITPPPVGGTAASAATATRPGGATPATPADATATRGPAATPGVPALDPAIPLAAARLARFSPAGDYLAAARSNANPTLYLYRLGAGGQPQPLGEIPLAAPVDDLRFAPDGTALAAGDAGGVTLWAVPSGRVIARLVPTDRRRFYSLRQLAFSADGALLAADDPGHGLVVWSVADGREVAAIARTGNPVNSLAFAPGGRSLLAVEPGVSTFHLPAVAGVEEWEIATGRRLAFHPLPTPEEGELGPDGATVSWRADGGRGTQAATRDLPDGPTRLLAPYRATPQEDVALLERPALAFAGRYLLWGTSRGEVLIWDRATGALVRHLGIGAGGGPTAVSLFRPVYRPDDGLVLALTGDGWLATWPITLAP